ncbi:MAG: hypothetical protein NXY57DRAFT_590217 [Lentinula lateritia]|uniref:Uncharacterized protein n=1 Tax=Lentinula lateritia TaxID=40482 RepID=A0ABQ8VHZ9_9AGAR|nr:MAG: hypothetical protein NXY57DRAFT_590217 [Lentinula lateritia]KAJ4495265.1 hypothetical protein C8R41DRAFT_763103 [Lentinula lateritia]
MPRPSLLGSMEPLDALCHHFNVVKTFYTSGDPLPKYIDMPITRDAHMPSHALALYQSTTTSSIQPLIVPIDADMYNNGFRVDDLIPPVAPGSASPVPFVHPNSGLLTVTLPLVPISLPHIASIPLLLLFGLGLETQTNFLALHLLPPQVISEFPNSAEMARQMSLLAEEEFQRRVRYNQGMWKNVLALGVQDTKIVELVQTAWNVTAEARRFRQFR